MDHPRCPVIRHGTEEQKADEWNQELSPPVARAFLYLRAGKLADDIQNEFQRYGVMRIKGEEPTDEEVQESLGCLPGFCRHPITEANSGYERYGRERSLLKSWNLPRQPLKTSGLRHYLNGPAWI